MSVNLAEKYSTQVDEVIRKGLLSSAGTNNDVEFGGAQTVKVYSLDTAPLNDYDPTAGMSRYGEPVELEDTVQTLQMTQQKSFTFTIDKTYESDSPEGVRNAGKALQRQIEQVIIPAIDTYRFGVLADKAGTVIEKELDSTNAYSTFVEANTAITDEEFPIEGRVAFCSNAFIEKLKKDGGFTKATELGNAEAANEAGYILTKGGFGLKKDEEEAFDYFLEAAELDHPEAMRYVIRAYREGIVEDEDNDLEYWITRSEGLDIPENYAQIGWMMYEDENYEEAAQYLFYAFQGGMFSVCPILSTMHIKGEGVKVDTHLAMCYLRDGAKGGDETCMNRLKQLFPEEWAQLEPEIEASVNYRELLIKLVGALTPVGNQEYFLKLIDAYREKFIDNTYIQEINRQLSIHRPSTDNGGNGDGQRRIVVRRAPGMTIGYEIVVILANGTEVVVNNINVNSLMIYLLAIICSYKSGYTSVMAKNTDCRPIIVDLYKRVIPNAKDSEAKFFIENFLYSDNKNRYYKQYSYRAANAISEAIGVNDEPMCYLFDNEVLKNRKVVRRMRIDAQNIDLPSELFELAQMMPDAMDVLELPDKQEVME